MSLGVVHARPAARRAGKGRERIGMRDSTGGVQGDQRGGTGEVRSEVLFLGKSYTKIQPIYKFNSE